MPGRQILVAGNGPLNLQVADELVAAGAQVVAVAEAAPRPGMAQLPALLSAISHAPGLIRDGFGYLRRLRRASVPVLYGYAIVAAEGSECVQSATIARIDPGGRPIVGSELTFEVDAVCAGYGFLPANEIARALGCRHRHDPVLGSLVTERDACGQTSVPGVYVAGDSAGMGGARAALEDGAIAGYAAAQKLGHDLSPALLGDLAARRRAVVRHRRFQVALWRLFAAPPVGLELCRPDTLICRCESVSLKSVREAVADGVTDLGSIKRLTRAGMGRCQGRYCAPVMLDLVAAMTGHAVDEFSYFAPQSPLKPTSVEGLAQPPRAPHHTISERVMSEQDGRDGERIAD